MRNTPLEGQLLGWDAGIHTLADNHKPLATRGDNADPSSSNFSEPGCWQQSLLQTGMLASTSGYRLHHPIKHTHSHHLYATPECLACVFHFIFPQRERGMKESLCWEQLGLIGSRVYENWRELAAEHKSERPVTLAVATATHTKHTDSIFMFPLPINAPPPTLVR